MNLASLWRRRHAPWVMLWPLAIAQLLANAVRSDEGDGPDPEPDNDADADAAEGGPATPTPAGA